MPLKPNSDQVMFMSRGDLLDEIKRLREEIERLKQERNVLVHQDTTNSECEGKRFEMSRTALSIVCNSGSNKQHKYTNVPLESILQQAMGKGMIAEADTPVASTLRHTHWPGQSDSPSLPTIASTQQDESATDLQFVPSVNVGEMLRLPSGLATDSLPLRLESFSDASSPLNFGPLAPDAIMSVQTARSFIQPKQLLSPILSTNALAILQYVNEIFIKTFTHNLNDRQRTDLGMTLIALCDELTAHLTHHEPRHVSVASPVYVFGDIHGNLRDLHFFITRLVLFDDVRFMPYRLLFLGDYVDRGEFSVECIALLFALKVLAPHKVVLLRGNHEDPAINGDVALYGTESFRVQSVEIFGSIIGQKLWRECNKVFAALPLTANIDDKIFCTHGGLPRFDGTSRDTRLETLSRADFPRFTSFFMSTHTVEEEKLQEMARDACWSDPAEFDAKLDEFGFGPNSRGNGVFLFGSRAVDMFLERYGFEFIFRAHQEKAKGLKVSQNSRVLTIFSTSAYAGHQNGAGLVYVGSKRIRLIIKENK